MRGGRVLGRPADWHVRRGARPAERPHRPRADRAAVARDPEGWPGRQPRVHDTGHDHRAGRGRLPRRRRLRHAVGRRDDHDRARVAVSRRPRLHVGGVGEGRRRARHQLVHHDGAAVERERPGLHDHRRAIARQQRPATAEHRHDARDDRAARAVEWQQRARGGGWRRSERHDPTRYAGADGVPESSRTPACLPSRSPAIASLR